MGKLAAITDLEVLVQIWCMIKQGSKKSKVNIQGKYLIKQLYTFFLVEMDISTYINVDKK